MLLNLKPSKAKYNIQVKGVRDPVKPGEKIKPRQLCKIDGYSIYLYGNFYLYDAANKRLVEFQVLEQDYDLDRVYKQIVDIYKAFYL